MNRSIFSIAAEWWTPWQTVRDWAESGTIPAPQICGGLARWSQATLDAWEAAGFERGPKLSDEECAVLATALLLEITMKEGT